MNNETATMPHTTTKTHLNSSLQPPACRADSSRQSVPATAEDLIAGGARIEQHVSIIERRIARIESSPSIIEHPESSIAQPPSSSLACVPRHRIRNGKIARLPKLERDLVNRMLYNNIPYPKIVAALDELEVKATRRNISNWKTRGGYKEWCAEQERQINLSRLQDTLTDYLRKNDAGQLPEVGLQVAATQLSSMLLHPETAQQLGADPKKYSQVIDMLCRLSTHIQALQKDRNEAVKQAAIRGTSEHFKHEDEKTVEEIRSVYSSIMGKGPRDPDIPHRNDFRRRDALPFQEPPPKAPTLLEILQAMRKPRPTVPALPAPQSKPAETPAAENTPPHNGSPDAGGSPPPL